MTHPQVPLSGVSEARVRGILARLKQEDARTRFVFTEVYEASALHEAREADRRRHLGLCLGPLDGVVVSVKDLFDIRGIKPARAPACWLPMPPRHWQTLGSPAATRGGRDYHRAYQHVRIGVFRHWE